MMFLTASRHEAYRLHMCLEGCRAEVQEAFNPSSGRKLPTRLDSYSPLIKGGTILKVLEGMTVL